MVKKDTQRSFTKKQKEYMFEIQEKKCKICQRYFSLNLLEACHKKEYARGGKTQVENGFLACPTCHTAFDKGLNLKIPTKRIDKSIKKDIKTKNVKGIGKNNPIKKSKKFYIKKIKKHSKKINKNPIKNNKIPKSFGF